ncbi:Uncharacterised protein [Collinsella intestinalis]|nr:Uncharacterised protein [Collinsella intestinalis]
MPPTNTARSRTGALPRGITSRLGAARIHKGIRPRIISGNERLDGGVDGLGQDQRTGGIVHERDLAVGRNCRQAVAG